jgi:hypothetical protein
MGQVKLEKKPMMRRMGFVFVGFVLFAWTAEAQTSSGYQGSFSSIAGVGFAAAPGASRFAASGTWSASPDAFAQPEPANAPSPPEPPQGVYGVFPKYDWEASVGYEYEQFHEVPDTTESANGFQASAIYYPKDWVGAEGEVSGVFGSLFGSTSSLIFGGAGARVRWSASRKYQLWAHGLVGVSGLTPKQPFGAGHAFGYELGAGVDIKARGMHWSYRVEGDLDGSFYFSTYQVSPKVAISAVYEF